MFINFYCAKGVDFGKQSSGIQAVSENNVFHSNLYNNALDVLQTKLSNYVIVTLRVVYRTIVNGSPYIVFQVHFIKK